MKLTAKQFAEVHNHMKRHGVSFERARARIVGGSGTAAAERQRMYEDRRVAERASQNAGFSDALSLLWRGGRR
jgi:hypothetical protein